MEESGVGKKLFKLKLMANVGIKIGATEVVMVNDDLEIMEDVVVRLLGRTIGYKTLINIIQTLWKHIGSFQVIDRDNDYYLVKFALSQDYTKAHKEGPWMVYGNYVTV
ncbi:hypothetical protein GOBAR_DD13144 [Gossypium barbadense]|nr:hypothetical protein GOBAR_DD13144 [Gossypium barbadense]